MYCFQKYDALGHERMLFFNTNNCDQILFLNYSSSQNGTSQNVIFNPRTLCKDNSVA